MSKFCKISLTSLLIIALFLANVCPAAAAEISTLTFTSKDAPPVMQSWDTATQFDAEKQEPQDNVPDGDDGELIAEPKGEPVLLESEPGIPAENLPPGENP